MTSAYILAVLDANFIEYQKSVCPWESSSFAFVISVQNIEMNCAIDVQIAQPQYARLATVLRFSFIYVKNEESEVFIWHCG